MIVLKSVKLNSNYYTFDDNDGCCNFTWRCGDAIMQIICRYSSSSVFSMQEEIVAVVGLCCHFHPPMHLWPLGSCRLSICMILFSLTF